MFENTSAVTSTDEEIADFLNVTDEDEWQLIKILLVCFLVVICCLLSVIVFVCRRQFKKSEKSSVSSSSSMPRFQAYDSASPVVPMTPIPVLDKSPEVSVAHEVTTVAIDTLQNKLETQLSFVINGDDELAMKKQRSFVISGDDELEVACRAYDTMGGEKEITRGDSEIEYGQQTYQEAEGVIDTTSN